MDYQLWKLLHVAGVMLLFASLGGLAALTAAGVATPGTEGRRFRIFHGVALLLVLVAGFGLLAKLGMHGPGSWAAWVWVKLGVWVLLGAGIVALRRAGRMAGTWILVLVLLGAIAAWAALTKLAF